MKKILLGCMIMAAASNLKAQVYIQGGLNLANITTTSNGNTEDNTMLPTFNVGLMSRFGLSKVVDLESGVLFTGKGSRAQTYFNNGNDYIKTKFNPEYIEVPLNLVVKFPLAKGTGLFVSGGPYAAIGIAGKSKTESKFGPLSSSSSSDIQFSNDSPFTSEQDDAAYNKLKRFDFGLNFGGGFEFAHLILKVNYGLGLAKINSTQSNNSVDSKNKFRTLSFSLGIPLGK